MCKKKHHHHQHDAEEPQAAPPPQSPTQIDKITHYSSFQLVQPNTLADG